MIATEVFAFYRRGHMIHIHQDKKVFERWMRDSTWLYPPSECQIVRYVSEEAPDLLPVPKGRTGNG